MSGASTREAGILLELLDRVDAADAEQQNDLGVVLHRRGLSSSAVEAFASAAVLDPTFTLARRNLAHVLTDPDGRSSRLEAYRAQAASDPDAAEPWVVLARLAFVRGDAGELGTAVAAARRLGARDPWLPWIEVAAAIDAGRLDEAEGRLVEVASDEPLAWRWRALLAYRRGELRAARDLVEVAVARAPGDADALLLRAFILGDLGETGAARQAHQAAVLLRPGLGRGEPHLRLDAGGAMPASVEAPPADGDRAPTPAARRALGIAALELGHTALAERALEVAFAADPDVRGATALATIAMRRGDLGAAFSWFDRLVTDHPADATLWNARGVAAHRLGRWTEAEASYREALARAPDDPVVVGNLAVVHAHQGRWSDAASGASASAVQGSRAIRRNAAMILAAAGEVPAARVLMTALLAEGAPADETPALWYGLGRLAFASGAFETAREAAERALLVDATFAAAWHLLAAVHEGRGDALAAAVATDRGLAAASVAVAPGLEPLTHEAAAGRGGG